MDRGVAGAKRGAPRRVGTTIGTASGPASSTPSRAKERKERAKAKARGSGASSVEEGHFTRDCPRKGKGKGKSKGKGKGKGYNSYNNYGGGQSKGGYGGWAKGGVNSFSQGYATAYAQQPEGNLCLAFERGGSGLIADADLAIDQTISEFVVVERPEPDEIPWHFPIEMRQVAEPEEGDRLEKRFSERISAWALGPRGRGRRREPR